MLIWILTSFLDLDYLFLDLSTLDDVFINFSALQMLFTHLHTYSIEKASGLSYICDKCERFWGELGIGRIILNRLRLFSFFGNSPIRWHNQLCLTLLDQRLDLLGHEGFLNQFFYYRTQISGHKNLKK